MIQLVRNTKLADARVARSSSQSLPLVRVGLSKTHRPLKSEPTIVTQSDITDYLRIVIDLMSSLNDDMLAHIVYKDPEAEQNQVESLLASARSIDGCDLGLGCPGWKEGDTPTTPQIAVASNYRREAFQHRVDARLMEDRVSARSMTRAQVQTDLVIWKDWQSFKERVISYLKTIEGFTIVKSSDFTEAQRFDLEMQDFRDRYTASTGLEPSTPLPPIPPDTGIFWTNVPWGWLVFGFVLIGGAVLLNQVRGAAHSVAA